MDAESLLIRFQRTAFLFLFKKQVEIKATAAGIIVKSLLSSPALPDDLSLPLAVPLHPTLPAGTGRRAQRSVPFHCGRGLPILRPLRAPCGHQLRGPGHQYNIPVRPPQRLSHIGLCQARPNIVLSWCPLIFISESFSPAGITIALSGPLM